MTERDPHLLAALRHAPDHDAQPPHEVSERILAAARAAVRAERAVPLWRRWLDGLAQPRVAAAFGTLAVATIVGVMWATHEAPPLAVGPADTPPSPTAERKVLEATAPSPARSEIAAAPAAPTEQPRQSPPPVVAAAKRATAEPRADLAAAPAAPVGKAETAQETAAETVTAASPRPAAPQALPSPAPAAANLRGSPGALADAVVAGNARTAAPAQTASSLALQAKERAADPGAALDALVQAGPAWLVPAGRRAQGDAQRRWWAAVQAATTGRWQAVEHAPAGAAALEWDAGGSGVTRFWFDGDALVCRDAAGRVWRAAVGTAAVRDWQAELARW